MIRTRIIAGLFFGGLFGISTGLSLYNERSPYIILACLVISVFSGIELHKRFKKWKKDQ
jgi:PleD family two-component response regulator